MTLNKLKDTQIINFRFLLCFLTFLSKYFGFRCFKFYLSWNIGVGSGRGDSCNSVVLLNQLSNVYKYVTNSGLSSMAPSMKSQYV